ISDNGVNENTNFTDSYALDNLMAGTYTVCITGTDGTIDYEEFCFDAVVSEPQLLNVTSLISEDGTQLMLTLEGGDQYTVELNGTSAQTQDSEITVQLTNGLNTLKVSTDLPCQGTFEEQIFASDQPIVYPNPFVDIIQVFLGTQTDVVDVTVHTSDGRLIRNTRYAVNGNEMGLDFTGLPSGMYFITLNGLGVKGTYKVLKQ
ncbi:MAG: T9SS type A sorting domain-containing protein, partial [Bacteroidota bacterium]